MATYQCGTCNGQGGIRVPKTDKDGKTVYVPQQCGTCRGKGKIER